MAFRLVVRAAVIAVLGLPVWAFASEFVQGSFQASVACDAYQSFAKGTNPSGVKTVAGSVYEAREINSASEFSWIRILVPDADPPLRWVSKSCDVADFEVAPKPGPAPSDSSKQCNVANTYDSYVLAITWQPGFCEHFKYQGEKPECNAMASSQLVVSNLTLHGLWPNKKGCIGNDLYASCGGSPLDLSDETIAKLQPWMPNFFYETAFGAYEWRKHGVCQALDDDDYFLKALAALQLFNGSVAGKYIRDNIGGSISRTQLIQKIDQEAGESGGKNVTVLCSNQKYLQEVRISLSKDFSIDAGMAGLMKGGTPLPSVQGCSGDVLVIERSGPD